MKIVLPRAEARQDKLFSILHISQQCLRPSHRVGRVLSFFSSRRHWDFPNPSPASECAPLPHPTPALGGGAHSLAREGLGEPQFRRGEIHCGTLYIYVLCGPGVRCNQRGFIYTEHKPICRLCKMCNPFFSIFILYFNPL
jgi:hypothetical protein